MIGNLFAPLAMKIAGGLIAALLAALALVIWRADAISDDREALRNTLSAERATHAVTRRSLDVLQAELEQLVKDGQLRAERLAEARQEARKETEALREQAERIRAEAGGDPCVTPEAVRKAPGL